MAKLTAQDRKWEAEDAARVPDRERQVKDAARTLVRAEEIKANKQLFSQAKKELVKQQKAVLKVIGKAKDEEG